MPFKLTLNNVPYYAVSNGWQFSLYDRDNDTQVPILTIAQSEIPTRFDELRRMIGAEQITFHLKRRLIERIEQVLGADVTLERPEEFLQAVERTVSKVRPKVLENFRAARKKNESVEAYWTKLLDTARSFELVETALASVRTLKDMDIVSMKIADKILALPNSGDTYLTFSKLLIEQPRPVLLHEHFNSLLTLATLASRSGGTSITYPESTLPGTKSPLTAKDIFGRWSHVLLTHFKPRPELRFLWAAEALLGRIMKRMLISNWAARRGIMQATDFQRYQLPEDLLAAVTVSPAGGLLILVTQGQMAGLASLIRESFDGRKFLAAKAKQEYQRLCKIEDELIKASPDYSQLRQELGSEWSELLMIDSINVTFDKLGAGVCDVLSGFPELTKQLPSDCHDPIRTLAGLGIYKANECCQLIAKEPMKFSDEEAASIRSKIFDPFS